LIEALYWAEREARAAIAEDDRRDDDVKAIETAGREETRESVRAALDEDTAQPNLSKAAEDGGRRYISVFRGQGENLDAGYLATRALSSHDNSARAVIGQHASRRCNFALRIDDDAHRIGTGDATNGQLGVIREHAADSDDDSIDEGA
jgi:glycosyltransferase 2 family protein